MTEYLKDRDGDVWAATPGELVHHRHSDGRRADAFAATGSRTYVEGIWGPLVPCTESGTPLTSEPAPDAVRALVAGALQDVVVRLCLAYHRELAGSPAGRAVDVLLEAVRETADAVLRGDVKPAEVTE
ncbi:hypothetical protein ACIF6L_26455 [Kitasatospora sp. NPDC086009]|uniref:hypothetical protein n=1 Tax=unclassified Kitasatospora TaxID=2633591 RepID=UPI0037C9EDBF